MHAMREDIQKILISQEQLAAKVQELGAVISADYEQQKNKLLMIGVLKGSVVFMADLMRAMTIPLAVDFMAVSSYGSGAKTSGVVKIVKDLDVDIRGLDLLVVEDILDSGMTLRYLTDILSQRGPNSIRIVALLDKPQRRAAKITADYAGFTIPDEFVVGYGLDYDEKYRNLPYVGALRRNIYDNTYVEGDDSPHV